MEKETEPMPWYWIALIVSLVIGPFDALYVYIKAQKRKEKLRQKRELPEATTNERERTPECNSPTATG